VGGETQGGVCGSSHAAAESLDFYQLRVRIEWRFLVLGMKEAAGAGAGEVFWHGGKCGWMTGDTSTCGLFFPSLFFLF